ncbi:sigma-70 family RNA polymerase sigma factor [Rhodoflexus caldus]|uniref:sigma-70 family RNA polymerase sigma factor n=1 Tax=Rhodoflexus caldus TaxID=2891236 RepID=UPI00202A2DD7|nr:sigma-70 family RNA polymerase sigma factor [Rhodoflexus caldus]
MEIQFDVLRNACLPFVKKMVIRNSGSLEDAEEILSDALLIYLSKGKPADKATPATYVCAVACRLWMKELRRRRIAQRHSQLLKWHREQEQAARCAYEEEQVLCAFENLPNDRSKQILTAFYLDKMSMVEIAHHFGLSSENAAKKQKFRAINNVRALLRNELPHVFHAA